MAGPYGGGGAHRELPDPAFVPHVRTEQHLEVAHKLADAERLGRDLSSQVATLQRSCADSEASLRQARAEAAALARGKEASDAERDRLLQELSEVRQEAAQARMSIARLERELAEAKADRGPLA